MSLTGTMTDPGAGEGSPLLGGGDAKAASSGAPWPRAAQEGGDSKGLRLVGLRRRRHQRGMAHWKRCLLLVSLVVAYWLVGAVVMLVVEKWNFLHSTYFAVATMLAIGYGDFYPTLPGTKIFTAVYVFAGITLTTMAAAINLAQDLAWLYEEYCDDIDFEEEQFARRSDLRWGQAAGIFGAIDATSAAAAAGDAGGEEKRGSRQGGSDAVAEAWNRRRESNTQSCMSKCRRLCDQWDVIGLLWSTCSICIFLLTGTLFLTYVEGGKFSALNSFYFTAVTMGHVGYGDITPQKPISLAFLIIFILCTWGGYTVIMGKLINAFVRQEHLWELDTLRLRTEAKCERRMKALLFMQPVDDLLEQRRQYLETMQAAQRHAAAMSTAMDVDDADNPEMTPAARPPQHGPGSPGVPGRDLSPSGTSPPGRRRHRRSLFGIFG